MYIKIYFNEKPVYLCNEINDELDELLHHPDAVFIDELSTAAINSLLHEIKKENFHCGILWHSDFEKLKKKFFKHFTLIEAAGGIVQNKATDILFIFRRGKWDLPKGKIEKGESPDSSAIREVAEETGVANVIIKKKLGETFHSYNDYGKEFLKTTHWYHMLSNDEQQLLPQQEEDITEVKWIAYKDITTPMANTYESIREIMSVFFDGIK